jgi:hypothetical protein
MLELGRLIIVASVVVRCFRRWSLGGSVASRHAAVNHKVCAIDKTALVARKEKNCLSLLNGFTKTTSGEVDFTTVALGLVIAEPVLEKRCTIIVNMHDNL